jgi:hypothetical protein
MELRRTIFGSDYYLIISINASFLFFYASIFIIIVLATSLPRLLPVIHSVSFLRMGAVDSRCYKNNVFSF